MPDVECDAPATVLGRTVTADEGVVCYAGMLRGAGKPSARDSFKFQVQSTYSSALRSQTMGIDISVGNINADNVDSLLTLATPEVVEGGSLHITDDMINTDRLSVLGREYKLFIEVVDGPSHGTLTRQDGRITLGRGDTFDDADLRHRPPRLIYRHDHSNTHDDHINITVIFRDEKRPQTVIRSGITVMFTIRVMPVNDEPFELITKSPILRVVKGYQSVITSQHLNTIDKDTPAEDIVYKVTLGPSNGRIINANDTGSDPASLRTFTQADVNSNNLLFIHSSDTDTGDGAFYFDVSDGHFKAESGQVTIKVVELSLELINRSNVEIVQSYPTVAVTRANLGADTNGERSLIQYNITRPPSYGYLLYMDTINDLEEIAVNATSFTQDDIDAGRIYYEQVTMTALSDYFNFIVSNSAQQTLEHTLHITVVPLITQRQPLVAYVGEATLISTDFLDATELAERSGTNPLFELSTPRYGFIQVSSSRKRQVQASRFTHEDVVANRVYYVMSDDNTLVGDATDNIEYYLSAGSGVQKARGNLKILVHATRTTTPPLPESHTTSPPTIQQREHQPLVISDNHIIIIGIVCGALLIAIIVVIFIRCYLAMISRQEKQAGFHYEESTSTGYSHGGAMAGNGHVNNGAAASVATAVITDGSSGYARTEICPTVPTCKVTPLPTRTPPPVPPHGVGGYRDRAGDIKVLEGDTSCTSSTTGSSCSDNGTGGDGEGEESYDWQPPLLSAGTGVGTAGFNGHGPPPPSTPMLRRNQYWV